MTSGNNDIGPFTNSDGQTYHVPGFSATPGYDLASGLGTVDAARFVPALATGRRVAKRQRQLHGSMSFASVQRQPRRAERLDLHADRHVVSGVVTVEGRS